MLLTFMKKFTFHVFLLLPFICLSHSNTAHRIALGSQGKAAELTKWIQMYSHMNSSSHVTLFVLTYDEPIPEALCQQHGVQCMFKPHTTWTSGRNGLLRAMRTLESINRNLFKYYAFADDDIVNANCHAATGCGDAADKSACCFDAVTFFLLSSIEYAVVNFVTLSNEIPNTGGILKVVHYDCADGAFNAYHRAAAPALLPYVELVDRFSWWGSQAIMWTVIGGCLPGYSMYVGIFSLVSTTGHANYPKGRYNEVEHDSKEAVFSHRGLSPWPINIDAQMVQGNCMKIDKPGSSIHSSAWTSGDWVKLESFRKCYSSLKPRFDSFVKTGNLSATDFIDFGSYRTVP